jgi:tRNA G10  N-methylase Trm11
MEYFFILGNNPALSAAEIAAVLRPETSYTLADRGVLLAETPATDPKILIKRLGGTIKIGEVISLCPTKKFETLKEEIYKVLDDHYSQRVEKNKYCFGFSYYGPSYPDIKKIGMESKGHLKKMGVSARFVVSREKNLSSVMVEQNNLLSGGAEIVLIERPEGIVIGRTLAVQDFKGLESRDFKRPSRDDQSGMLPPKLAQIMLNLSRKIPCHCDCEIGEGKKCPTILDPFCGSGTVLQEAALMGVEKLIGSDISPKAVSDTEANMEWLKENWQSIAGDWQFLNLPAQELSKKIPQKSIDAVVTEPYLGPQRGWHDIGQTILELEALYSEALAEFRKILKEDGCVVMVWPVFAPTAGHGAGFLSPSISGWKISEPLPPDLKEKFKISPRNTIIYGREEQKVWREIVVLKMA